MLLKIYIDPINYSVMSEIDVFFLFSILSTYTYRAGLLPNGQMSPLTVSQISGNYCTIDITYIYCLINNNTNRVQLVFANIFENVLKESYLLEMNCYSMIPR
jgi:hypothetical protein